MTRSPVIVPGPLRDVVRDIRLEMDENSRPWMYYIWALLRDGVLLNIQSIDLRISGDRDKALQERWDKSEIFSLLDIGLPRTLPSAHPIHLRTLDLRRLKFRSHAALLRCLAYHHTERIYCDQVEWPGESVISPLPRYPSSRLGLPKQVRVSSCTAISPFVWSIITPYRYGPRMTPRLLYIRPAQINIVLGIIRLFSDECECKECKWTKWRVHRLRVDEGML